MSDSAVEEKELVRFHQADVFLKTLLGGAFYPGGLGKDGRIEIPDEALKDDTGRQRTAKGEESMRKLTSIVSGPALWYYTLSSHSLIEIQLDEYQEQSYLIDPHLEAFIVPVVKALQELTRRCSNDVACMQKMLRSTDVQRLARLLYYYTKVRGYKTIGESVCITCRL